MSSIGLFTNLFRTKDPETSSPYKTDENMKKEFNGKLINMQEQLYFYALQLTDDQDDAKDLVQETSYKALRSSERLHDSKHIKAWLFTILKNTYINYLRSGHNKQLISEKDSLSQQIDNFSIAMEDKPDEILFRKELNDIIKLLPGVYGQPIIMFLSGYSYKEIAQAMEVPIGTVKSRIHLGKKKIRNVYSA